MKNDTSVLAFRQPESIEDPLTEIAREGARRMLATALEAEVSAFVEQFAEERLPDGRQRVVRHGRGPERTIQTGIGPLEVRRPKVRDRATGMDAGAKARFTSHILPKWARRSRSLDALLPVLYLRGVSTGDFQEALAALLGPDAPNLSPSVIGSLKEGWQGEYDRWQGRDLSARHYVYIPPGPPAPVPFEKRIDGLLTIDGSTVSIFRRGWRTTRPACWSSSGRRPRARRNWSASRSAFAKAPRAGVNYSSIRRPAVLRLLPRSRSAMAPWDFGKRSRRSFRRPGISDAGSTS